MKFLEDRAAKSDDAAERDQARREASLLSQDLPQVPPEPRLLLDDATPEYVAKALAEQGGGPRASASCGIPSWFAGSSDA